MQQKSVAFMFIFKYKLAVVMTKCLEFDTNRMLSLKTD